MLVPISYQICGVACNDGKGRAVPKSLPQLWAMVVVSRRRVFDRMPIGMWYYVTSFADAERPVGRAARLFAEP